MWFYVENDARKGPISLEKMQLMLSDGTIAPDTLVWKKGMQNWLTVSESELRGFLPEGLPLFLRTTPPPIPVRDLQSQHVETNYFDESEKALLYIAKSKSLGALDIVAASAARRRYRE